MEQYLLDFFTWVSAELLIVVCKNPGEESEYTLIKTEISLVNIIKYWQRKTLNKILIYY